MLIFLFSAWACATIGRTAQEIVNEVRRQFIERTGIMDYKEKPNYGRCVSIIVSASLRVMINPGALNIKSPTIGGDWMSLGLPVAATVNYTENIGAKKLYIILVKGISARLNRMLVTSRAPVRVVIDNFSEKLQKLSHLYYSQLPGDAKASAIKEAPS
ncbi:putative K(+)-stimulated pyrophosphate-energized sodium pump [Capsicum chinense]|nr:putative K(+)-stimulated pyrophosphate-energized sodium pump [Capsicum chinense]